MKIEKSFKCLGTDINLVIIIKDDSELGKARKDLKEGENIFRKFHKQLSRFDSNSELSKVNANLGNFQEVSDDFLKLSQLTLDFYEKTNKIFDPRVYEIIRGIGYSKDFSKIELSKVNLNFVENIFDKDFKKDLLIKNKKVCFQRLMDFTGIAKGFIVDVVRKKFSENGWGDFLIDAGGDIFAEGKNDRQEKWVVEIEGVPAEKLQILLSNEAVATSGISRRKWEKQGKKFHHLVNPNNPQEFLFDLRTVSVVIENVIEADVWAKVLFLLGKEKGVKFAKKRGLKAVFLDYKGNVQCSSNAKLNFL